MIEPEYRCRAAAAPIAPRLRCRGEPVLPPRMPIEQAMELRKERITRLRGVLAALPLATAPALSLEIGCGHGHFLTSFAATRPDQYCVAIDLLRERLERAARKSQRVRLTNVAWVKAEADDLLDAWPSDLWVNRHVFILFPDPWPKRRHWKNRLIQPAFLTRLAAICAPGTQLCFRTDHAPYFAEASTVLDTHPDWRRGPANDWPYEQPTVFEQRAASFQSAVAYRH